MKSWRTQLNFGDTPYQPRCLRGKQLLVASKLMRAAYHEKEVQFNPIKDNQRPTANTDESTSGCSMQSGDARRETIFHAFPRSNVDLPLLTYLQRHQENSIIFENFFEGSTVKQN